MITIGATGSTHARSGVRARRRVELLNASSGLNGQTRRDGKAHVVNSARRGHEIACHYETRATPELVENRVSSTFAAQVLAQGPRAQSTDPSRRAQAYAHAMASARAPQLLRLA